MFCFPHAIVQICEFPLMEENINRTSVSLRQLSTRKDEAPQRVTEGRTYTASVSPLHQQKETEVAFHC